MMAAIDTFPTIQDELPFISSDSVLAEDIVYRGYGAELRGRSVYQAAVDAWSRELPTRLNSFEVADKVVLPADSRGRINGRYKLRFLAPVPPQVLPAQRERVLQANLTRTADGLVAVEATIACTLQLDSNGRVTSCAEYLTIDPFAVTATIAHFELCYWRALVASSSSSQSPLAIAQAYWAALRELTRRELEEVKKQATAEDDELRALDGGELSNSDFERWFAIFVARNFLAGGAIGAVAYAVARTVKEAAEGL